MNSGTGIDVAGELVDGRLLEDEITRAMTAARWPGGDRMIDVDERLLRTQVVPEILRAVHRHRALPADRAEHRLEGGC